MTKSTGIGRGGRKTGGRPASGLKGGRVGIKISGPRMRDYKQYLGVVEDIEVSRWLAGIFYNKLAELDQEIKAVRLG